MICAHFLPYVHFIQWWIERRREEVMKKEESEAGRRNKVFYKYFQCIVCGFVGEVCKKYLILFKCNK